MTQRSFVVMVLGAALATGAAAQGWLKGPGPYRQAVEALAGYDLEGARAWASKATPTEGRLAWLREQISELEEGEAPGARGTSAAYPVHNLYLFLRSEGIQDERLDAIHERARTRYEHVLADPDLVWEGLEADLLRLGFAGLCWEEGQGDRAERILARGAGASSYGIGPGGEHRGTLRELPVHLRMVMAYYETARGRNDRALDLLESAFYVDPLGVRRWVVRSDDFTPLKDEPRFREIFGEL